MNEPEHIPFPPSSYMLHGGEMQTQVNSVEVKNEWILRRLPHP